jgi:DNA-binding MarR family transcriptional regulator
MTAAGFGDRGFPDARILRLCRDADGVTVSEIGRSIGITRQGAAKAVTSLAARGYVRVAPSKTSGREKDVTITPRALAFLDAHRQASSAIEREVRRRLGPDAQRALDRLVDLLGDHDLRLGQYLRRTGVGEL